MHCFQRSQDPGEACKTLGQKVSEVNHFSNLSEGSCRVAALVLRSVNSENVCAVDNLFFGNFNIDFIGP